MRVMDAKEIARDVNTIKDGVDKSCFGPIFERVPNDITKKTLNPIAMQICVLLLQMYFKNPESWK